MTPPKKRTAPTLQKTAEWREQIHPALLALAVPIGNLTPIPGNPRHGDIEAVARSFKQFGQRKPLVARQTGVDADGVPTGIVTAGNHGLYAARDNLEWTHVAVVFTDDDDLTARAWALADNRTAELGKTDDHAVAEWLNDLLNGDVDPSLIHATGYDDNAIRKLLGADEDDLPPDSGPALGSDSYAVIVEARDQQHQAELLDAFESEGLSCRPLML